MNNTPMMMNQLHTSLYSLYPSQGSEYATSNPFSLNTVGPIFGSVNNLLGQGYQTTGQGLHSPTGGLFQVNPSFASQLSLSLPPSPFQDNLVSSNSTWSLNNPIYSSTSSLSSPGFFPNATLYNSPPQHASLGVPSSVLVSPPVVLSPPLYPAGQMQLPVVFLNSQSHISQPEASSHQQSQPASYSSIHDVYNQTMQQNTSGDQNETTRIHINNTSNNRNLNSQDHDFSIKTVLEIHRKDSKQTTPRADDTSDMSSSGSLFETPTRITTINESPTRTPTSLDFIPKYQRNLLASFQTPPDPSPSVAHSETSTRIPISSGQEVHQPVLGNRSVIRKSDGGEDSGRADNRQTSSSEGTTTEAAMTQQQPLKQSGHASLYMPQKPVYKKPLGKDICVRCQKRVYPMEKVGPIKELIYHKSCFTCSRCGTTLNLKNFHHNPNDSQDPSLFCGSHKPQDSRSTSDVNAFQIKSALTAPKLDKVTGQVRSDRQNGDVWSRLGFHSPPSASALSPTHEDYYYGMKADQEPDLTQGFDANTAGSKHSSPVGLSGSSHLAQTELQQQSPMQSSKFLSSQDLSEDIYSKTNSYSLELTKQSPSQQSEEPTKPELLDYNQNTPAVDLQELSDTRNQNIYRELLEKNIELQQQILDNDMNLLNRFNHLTTSGVGLTQSVKELQLSGNDNEHSSPDIIDVADLSSFPSSILPNSIKSYLVGKVSLVEDFPPSYVMSSIPLDNHNYVIDLDYNGPRTRQRTSSISTRQTSPMQIPTSPRSTDEEESRRSSFSSLLSSRGSVDLPSTTSPTSERPPLILFPGRTDRPSTSSQEAQPVNDSASRMMPQLSYSPVISPPTKRVQNYIVPVNETTRLDRPSQFS